jgi:membrane protein implicated in regulation of membrane protease activity
VVRPSPRFWIIAFSTVAVAVPGVAWAVTGGPFWAWPVVSALLVLVAVRTVKWAEKMTRPRERAEKR